MSEHKVMVSTPPEKLRELVELVDELHKTNVVAIRKVRMMAGITLHQWSTSGGRSSPMHGFSERH